MEELWQTSGIQFLFSLLPSPGEVCFREEVQGAVFVAELAVVQVALTAEVFQTRRKSSIVCSLLQNRADSPKVTFSGCNVHFTLTPAGPATGSRSLPALPAARPRSVDPALGCNAHLENGANSATFMYVHMLQFMNCRLRFSRTCYHNWRG